MQCQLLTGGSPCPPPPRLGLGERRGGCSEVLDLHPVIGCYSCSLSPCTLSLPSANRECTGREEGVVCGGECTGREEGVVCGGECTGREEGRESVQGERREWCVEESVTFT